MDILDAIGSTSLVRLRRVVPAGCAEADSGLEHLGTDVPAGSPSSPSASSSGWRDEGHHPRHR